MAPPKLLDRSRPASVLQPWPRLALCTCGSEILLAASGGQPFRLDPLELLPPGRCELCHGAGRVVGERRHVLTHGAAHDAKAPNYAEGAVPCARCRGTGRRGEDPNGEHVMVTTDDGLGRPFDGTRLPWEAAHHRHRC